MARRLKYTKARVEAILAAVRLGQPYMRAATAGDITYDTFREWRARHQEFSVALEQATAEGERTVLSDLRLAGHDGNVAAMLGWQERRFPDDWSRGERREHEVSGNINVRQFVRHVQAVADRVLPDDAAARQQFADGLMELDVEEEQ